MRLIPAHAGKTSRCAGASNRRAAHPRSRGENAEIILDVLGDDGSSPLTRGKHLLAATGFELERLIPAHAGKTSLYRADLRNNWAHPRSRGENVTAAYNAAAVDGSSPLTRGKLSELNRWMSTAGLIPAHAGKTYFRCLANWLSAAHPRSRGENAATRSTASPTAGSSPLTRGKPRRRARRGRVRRLIPAHAGKTGRAVASGEVGEAHPRSRGENALRFARSRPRCGSSPLTRGKPLARSRDRDPRRLIPAHAGKTEATASR